MNVLEIITQLKQALQEYESRLDHYSDEVFLLHPEPNAWSLGEVYSHIFVTGLMNLKALELCVEGHGATDTDGLNEFGEKLFALGHFPPGKYESPESVKSRVQNIHKSEAKELISKVNSRVSALNISDILQSEENQRIEHPRLGYLNANQWIQFMLIHSNHHLEQLERIERKLSMC
ncbi:DinB family protein [Solitalea lacus]|uniref:DinB family protein n=1 Tax=Solitalea lacus TaxID=2911172 RepID=UPI001EDBCA2D|nr:DinB family protein [Solitalea lacus]UKJ08208.1 DinB family protein [Solitalea lacus]